MTSSKGLMSLLAAGAIFFASEASALTFNFTGSSSNQTSFNVTGDDGITNIPVTGFSTNNGNLTQRKVDRTSSGMGVSSGGSDDNQVDGSGDDEILNFVFGSGSYQLVSATFGSVQSDDAFRLYFNGVNQGTADIPSNNTYNFAGTYIGTWFGFGVTESDDDFRISALTFNKVQQGGGAAVPEPSTVALLGLCGLGLIVRRMRAA